MKVVVVILILFIAVGLCSCTETVNHEKEIKIYKNEIEDNSVKNEYDDELNISGEEIKEYSDDEKINNESLIQELLLQIKEEASKGAVIDCEFKAKYDNLEVVIEKWGKDDEHTYVGDAKGEYYVYSNYGMVFGVNKGMQIFEVRTFNEKIKNINLNDVKKYYGTPDYDIISKFNERVIGYVINEDFKILLVFCNNEEEDKLVLDHYSVLYPVGTTNYMRENGEPREW